MNAYEVVFRVGTQWYRAITISASPWAARVDATRGIRTRDHGSIVESVRTHLIPGNPRVILTTLSGEVV